MLDFTSSLYLGLHHPSGSLRPWDSLTLGKPALLGEVPRALTVAAQLASLQGCERALLLPSTLHLFMDLFEVLAEKPVAIYQDAGSYPIARWGAERIAGRGVPLRTFHHHKPDSLIQVLNRSSGRRPVVLTDGFCPLCGGAAPLADYLQIVRRFGGVLVVDDTQALGILGENPGPDAPYGSGGGGSLTRSGLQGPDIVVGSSLAKGFGVPIAVLTGSDAFIRRFAANAASRVHCSPPSLATIHATEHALAVNRREGDMLRLRLANSTRRFRGGLARIGLAANGGLFPVQSIITISGWDGVSLQRALLHHGIHALPLRAQERGSSHLGFLITARHRPKEIRHCISTLQDVISRPRKLKRIA
jgi:8-amino-7-oxononanoate synthase